MKLGDRLSSQEAKAGDTFGFETTSSAAVDGVFLSAGTHGHGFVLAARAARGPLPGVLRLAARTLELPDGSTLPIALEPGSLERTLTTPHGVRVPVGGAQVYVGPDHSTNVVFERGTPFTVVAPPPYPEPTATAG